MFLQIHTLTSFAAALLNRDDAGLAKRIPFGNAERMRVSSQCLKRHWTGNLRALIEQKTGKWEKFEQGWRTRNFFERAVLPAASNALKEIFPDQQKHDEIAIAGTWELACGCFTKAKRKKDVEKLLEPAKLANPLEIPESMGIDTEKGEVIPSPKQPALFGRPEADFFVRQIVKIAVETNGNVPLIRKALRELVFFTWRERNKDKDAGTMVDALVRSETGQPLFAGIEGALFGRFVTSDILARSDAAVHVAHAFTVNPLDTEVDYFTVVDDLNRADETGAAHAGDMELGAGLFYGYVVVDVPLLVSNLCGCDPAKWKEQAPEALQDARDVLERLVQAIATVSPGAKLGATAPYARAELVLLETGVAQPRTLANAYLQALKPKGNPLQQAVDTLGQHLGALDEMYGREEQRFVASTQNTASLKDTPRAPVKDTVKAALDGLLGVD